MRLSTRLGLAVGVAALAPAFGAPARAATASWLQVEANEMTYVFAESMSFQLQATSEQPVDQVLLRYTVDEERPVNRRAPQFVPGAQVTATHQEQLERGAIPPAAVVTWWWEVTDAAGRTTTTGTHQARYLDQKFRWQTTDGGPVTVWWYGSDGAQAKLVASTAAADLDQVQRLVGSAAGPEVQIVTYHSQTEMRPALADRGATYEARLATLGARVAPSILVLDVGTEDDQLTQILAHELSHLVLHRIVPEDYVDVPLWLDEGLAMYEEGPLDASEQGQLDAAVRDDQLMSVRSLTSFPGQADLVPLAYAESRDIVGYLVTSRGPEAFRRLVDAIGTGEMTPDEAVLAVYGTDQLGLYQQYRSAKGLGPAVAPVAPRPRPRSGSSGSPCAAAVVLPALVAVAAARRELLATRVKRRGPARAGSAETGTGDGS
jgi:hypothetical protein